MLTSQNIFLWAEYYHVGERALERFWTFFHRHEQEIVMTMTQMNVGEISNITASIESISLILKKATELDEQCIQLSLTVQGQYQDPDVREGQKSVWIIGDYILSFTPTGEIGEEIFNPHSNI